MQGQQSTASTALRAISKMLQATTQGQQHKHMQQAVSFEISSVGSGVQQHA